MLHQEKQVRTDATLRFILIARQLLHSCGQFKRHKSSFGALQPLQFEDQSRHLSVLSFLYIQDVSLLSCHSNCSCGRCKFEGIWQIALSNSRVAYRFQMCLRHPSTMPVRQSGPLYPTWKKERIQCTGVNVWLLTNTRFRAVLLSNRVLFKGYLLNGVKEKLVWWSYGHCFVGAQVWYQLFPKTVHQAAGQQTLWYTASVRSLHGKKRKWVKPTVIMSNQPTYRCFHLA